MHVPTNLGVEGVFEEGYSRKKLQQEELRGRDRDVFFKYGEPVGLRRIERNSNYNFWDSVDLFPVKV